MMGWRREGLVYTLTYWKCKMSVIWGWIKGWTPPPVLSYHFFFLLEYLLRFLLVLRWVLYVISLKFAMTANDLLNCKFTVDINLVMSEDDNYLHLNVQEDFKFEYRYVCLWWCITINIKSTPPNPAPPPNRFFWVELLCRIPHCTLFFGPIFFLIFIRF